MFYRDRKQTSFLQTTEQSNGLLSRINGVGKPDSAFGSDQVPTKNSQSKLSFLVLNLENSVFILESLSAMPGQENFVKECLEQTYR